MSETIDYGPVRADGTLQRHDTIRQERPDINAPNRTVMGARRRDYLAEMAARDLITAAQWNAVEMFRDDLEIAAGSGMGIQMETASIRSSDRRYGPTERQVDAMTRSLGAFRFVGLRLGGVLSWCIIGGASGREYARMHKVPRARGAEMVRECLERLADFYSS